MAPRRAVEAFLPESLEHVVVLDVAARGDQVVVVFSRRLPVRVLEQVVLQLRSRHDLEPQGAGPPQLPPEHRAGRFRHELVGDVVLDVAQHHRCLLLPAQAAQGIQVGHQVEIAIAPLPVGQPVSLDRLHLHVHGQEVIAGVGALGSRRVQEITGVQPFAHEPAVEVGERHQHGVYLPLGHVFFQSGDVEHAGDFSHSVFLHLNFLGVATVEQEARILGALVTSYPRTGEISTDASTARPGQASKRPFKKEFCCIAGPVVAWTTAVGSRMVERPGT